MFGVRINMQYCILTVLTKICYYTWPLRNIAFNHPLPGFFISTFGYRIPTTRCPTVNTASPAIFIVRAVFLTLITCSNGVCRSLALDPKLF